MSPLLPPLKAALDRLVHEQLPGDDPAVQAFLQSGPELLDEATEHLVAYQRATAAQDPDLAPLEDAADVWEHVTLPHAPELLLGDQDAYEPARAYLSFEGEVAWEPEHGLQLVLEDGRAVCKVGPYDGHLTQAHAYGDPSLVGVVFRP